MDASGFRSNISLGIGKHDPAYEPYAPSEPVTATTRQQQLPSLAHPQQQQDGSSTNSLVETTRELLQHPRELTMLQPSSVEEDGDSSAKTPPTQQQQQPIDDHELSCFSAGDIADLVHLQRQQQQQDAVMSGSGADAACLQQQQHYYEPIHGHTLASAQEREPQEPSRIETRLHSLQEHLRRIAAPLS